MATTLAAITRAPGEGEDIVLGPSRVTIKLSHQAPGSPFEALEITVPPGFPGPLLHLHRQTDEVFYVLEGSLTLQLGERTIAAPAGSFTFVPRGLAHKYANPAEGAARFLLIVHPEGLEGYFRGLVAAFAEAGGQPNREVIARLYAEFDTELVP